MISLELILLCSLAVDPLLQEKCVGCHPNLIGFDPQEPLKNLPLAEKVIRKMRAGTMPPTPMEESTRLAFVEKLEKRLDQQVINPGSKPASMLNAAEYETSILSLFGIKIDASDFQLPLFSEYLRAATEISNKVQVKDLARLVKAAYRGLDQLEDLADAMKFYRAGGMKLAVQSILCSPRFLFRFEGVNPELELASRMSFFLWGGPQTSAFL